MSRSLVLWVMLLSVRRVVSYCDMASTTVEADLSSFGNLHEVGSYFVTDVSGTTYSFHVQGSSSQRRMLGASGCVIVLGTVWEVLVSQGT